MSECLFCRIVAGEIPATVVHETESTLAFRDISPKAPVHVLVIPKAHHTDLRALSADPVLTGEVVAAAAAVAEAEGVGDAWNVVVNNGASAGQSVFHAHLHVLGGYDGSPLPG